MCLILQIIMSILSPVWTGCHVHDTVCLVELRVSWQFKSSGIYVLHTLCYSTSHEDQYFHGKSFEFYTWISACNHMWTTTYEWSYSWAVPYKWNTSSGKSTRFNPCLAGIITYKWYKPTTVGIKSCIYARECVSFLCMHGCNYPIDINSSQCCL